MNYDTTRSHPRSLSQAFADERAHCIEGPQRKPGKVVDWGVAILVLVIVVLIGLNSLGVWK